MTGHEQPASTRTRRRWLLWSGLALSLLVYACVTTIWLTAPGRMEAGSNRIREGMTLKEVEAILGKPSLVLSSRVLYWSGDDGEVVVCFEEATCHRVQESLYYPDKEP